MMFRLSLSLPLLLMAAPALAAGPFQDTAALDRSVMAFTGVAVGMDGGARTPVDARLRLGQCPTVSLSWRTEAHDAVVVACAGPEWRIYVPVRMTATTPAQAAMRVAAAPVIKVAPVIKRGDPVIIEAGSPGFSISREGVAMGDAAPGGRFLVRVEQTKNPVQAVAIESGRAALPGWNNF